MRRQRETAVRLALGVSRARLLTQTLIESAILAGIGAIAALGVAQWGGAAIRSLLVGSPGMAFDTITDWRILGVVAAAALVAGVFTGTFPALLSRRGDLTQALKAGAREGTHQRSRTRAALLVAQSALAVVLLVGASLFVRSLSNVKTMRLGYDAERAMLVSRSMRGVVLDSAQRVALRRSLMARARDIPGVERAAWMNSVPFRSSSSTNLHVAGIDSVQRLGRFTFLLTTPEYFEAMGTRILRGRGFTDADSEGAMRVTVVSDAMARVLWPNKEALGQCLGVGSPDCRTVVGVAEDVVQNEDQLTDARRFHYYLPVDQHAPANGAFMMLRMRGNVAAQAEGVRKALQSVMPGQSYVNVQPFINAVDGARRSWQLGATLFVAFGVLALVVAAVGLHGVIAYNVMQRMHELGVRVALGARPPDILGLVVGQSARFALAGIIGGSALALFASRWLQPLLFRQSAKDPVVFALVAGVMLVVALIAAANPALRAARADPNRALRSE
jgi:predicted permease